MVHFDISSAKQYFELVVLPNFEDFYKRENHLSARYAINSAITAYHLIEWVYHEHINTKSIIYNANSKSDFIKKLKENGLENIDLLHDIATVSKHLTITRPKYDYIGSSQQVGEWNKLGWDDLGGGDFGYDYFLASKSDGVVTQVIFETRLRDYINWWKAWFT